MIRKKIAEIVKNIELFEPIHDVTWKYNNIIIRTYSKSVIDIEVGGILILLSDKETKFLLGKFLPKQKKRENDNKIVLANKQVQALNSISFVEDGDGN